MPGPSDHGPMPGDPPVESDPVGAFYGEPVRLTGAPGGPLSGMTIAFKDVFDVAGERTGAGNPDWRATHPPAGRTAPALQRLLDAGATLVGPTVCDELTDSLLGFNLHHGTPVNPVAPDSIPGGSSSGSAAATAAGLVDAGLGTDTCGSVRVPASHCGLYGLRPTHGRVPLEGVFGLAPSWDTVGWMTRDATTLWQLTDALLDPDATTAEPQRRIVIADDLWDAADPEVLDAMVPAVQRLAVRLEVSHLEAVAGDDTLRDWGEALDVLVGREAWTAHRAWLESVRPALSLSAVAGWDRAGAITDEQVEHARRLQGQARRRLAELLDPETVLLAPTTPEIAPLLAADDHELSAYARRTTCLTAPASLAGLPQVTVPAVSLAEYPVGLSLIGAPGTDRALAALAATVSRPAE
jgi:amidase